MQRQPKQVTAADIAFHSMLEKLLESPVNPSRNHPTRNLPMGEVFRFNSCPYVTVRKIAPNKALRELQWFLEGDSDECPEDLRDWWDGQLNPDGKYLHGYRANLQGQLDYVINGLKTNPQSRRLVMSAWDAETAPNITELNQNPKTPTPCHLVYVQFDVNASGKLDMLVVQRSGDILLGVPHNWIQHWFLLVYVSHLTGIPHGDYIWTSGNIHLYNEPSHLECASEIVRNPVWDERKRGKYAAMQVAAQFDIAPFWKIYVYFPDELRPETLQPFSTIRPKLL